MRWFTPRPDGLAPANAIERPIAAVLREAVTHIHRHARATQAGVSISIEDEMPRMHICDNGRSAGRTTVPPAAGSAA